MTRRKAKKRWVLSIIIYTVSAVIGVVLLEMHFVNPIIGYFFLFFGLVPLSVASHQLAVSKRRELALAVKAKTKELRLALKEAEEAKRIQSEFLAHISHEFRTPLNAIMGFSAATARESFGPINNPIYKEYAECVYQSGAHLLELVNNILELTKMKAHQLQPQCDWHKPQQIIEETIKIITGYPDSRDKEIIVLNQLPYEKTLFYVDRQLVRQVLLNIISNAVKFTNKGGRIEVIVSLCQDGLDISVKDNGIGIEESQLQFVLKPFAQIENMMTRTHTGTGLGLPLSAQIMQLHNGHLALESVFNEGTTVHLIFPSACLNDSDITQHPMEE